jgi:uncharacterized membrane protein
MREAITFNRRLYSGIAAIVLIGMCIFFYYLVIPIIIETWRKETIVEDLESTWALVIFVYFLSTGAVITFVNTIKNAPLRLCKDRLTSRLIVVAITVCLSGFIALAFTSLGNGWYTTSKDMASIKVFVTAWIVIFLIMLTMLLIANRIHQKG